MYDQSCQNIQIPTGKTLDPIWKILKFNFIHPRLLFQYSCLFNIIFLFSLVKTKKECFGRRKIFLNFKFCHPIFQLIYFTCCVRFRWLDIQNLLFLYPFFMPPFNNSTVVFSNNLISYRRTLNMQSIKQQHVKSKKYVFFQ